MIDLVPTIRKIIMNFFKKQLGYGYRCKSCDRNARITEVSCSESGFDYVSFKCPGCHDTWGMEFKENQIRKLMV